MLTIIRGLPGSGKSTLAKSLGVLHLEADMFFMKNGIYCYDNFLPGQAHAWCKEAVESALSKNIDVVVSNTFVKKWEVEVYTKMAEKLDQYFDIKTCKGNYGNVHNVPVEVIERMRTNWEHF